ncbi:MAG: DUF1559 domain-containing protein [Planctomycetaceae bacterium]|jgi:prepilin-type N-terminal cleavage/methylation domain-containing protein|nr:DUF1559 domain-containing protein [Planctomycetaceae bacterium]
MKTKHFSINRSAFTLIELLVTIAVINIMVAMVFPAILAMQEVVRRGNCQNNLNKIVIATKKYEESFGVLPSGTVNKTAPIRNVPIGNHLGWIPRILPFIEQTPLYNTIDFSKGVYDAENEQVWTFVTPDIFKCPSDYSTQGSRYSNYMACHEGTETPIDADNRGVFFLNSQLRSKDISDGNSCTIWFGEATIIPSSHWENLLPPNAFSPSLGWMSGSPGTIRNTGQKINDKPFYATWVMPFNEMGQINPAGFPYKISTEDNKNNNDTETNKTTPEILWATELPEQFQVGGFNSFHAGGANHALGDGNVRMIFETIDADVYKKLGQRNDGIPVSLD